MFNLLSLHAQLPLLQDKLEILETMLIIKELATILALTMVRPLAQATASTALPEVCIT